MRLISALLALQALSVLASPTSGRARISIGRSTVLRSTDQQATLARRGIPSKNCSSPKLSRVVNTPKGPVIGAVGNQATRYSLRYGRAARFADSTAVAAWKQPLNATALPPACAQSLSQTSASLEEDCLYANFYVPNEPQGSRKLPVFVWVHGGSFVLGSSTAPGLDGSNFAVTNDAIVVTLQYRLGLLGLLQASGLDVPGNMAVKDLILSLKFVRTMVGSFGGDPNSITLAGQSSGADLIRTLLATSLADSLFDRVILQSAPAAYGDHSPTTAALIATTFLDAIGCTSLACLRGKNIKEILRAQNIVFFTSPTTFPGVAAVAPFRPVIDGKSIRGNTFPLIDGPRGGLTRRDRAILITTVKDEAAPTIDSLAQQAFDGQPVPLQAFTPTVQELLFPAIRADTVLASHLYDPAANATDAMDALILLGTEYVWTCANQQLAINATAHRQATGGVYLAELDLGITYPGTYCDPGRVCHQDDILPTFGNGGTNLTRAQAILQREVLARWGGFMRTGSPNAKGLAKWPTVGALSASPKLLVFDGQTGRGRVATKQGVGCRPDTLWGGRVPFDVQLSGP